MSSDQYLDKGSLQFLFNENESLKDKTQEVLGEITPLGMITDLLIDDIDSDGDLDIMAIGEGTDLILFEQNAGKFILRDQSDPIIPFSWWWSIEKGDFDGDGDNDYLLGSLGKNNKFKPTADEPLHIYVNDFDSDMDQDVVLAKSKGGRQIPVRGRECSSEELPYILDRFADYDSYAKATLDEILPKEILASSKEVHITSFTSIYLENKGDFQFESHQLPIECQFGPIRDFVVSDFNDDGNLDFVFGGGHYPVEVETTRYDANRGGICFGDGKGGFTYIPYNRSGIDFDCDLRDLEIIEISGDQVILAACNNEGVIAFRLVSENFLQ